MGCAGGCTFVVICPARVTHLKGQHVLIEALGHLSAEDHPLSGTRRQRFRYGDYVVTYAHKAMRRASPVGWFSQVLRPIHMPAAYAAANLAVVPTIRPEPFGRTIIEAQAAELPVIASNGGGFRETVIAAALMRQHGLAGRYGIGAGFDAGIGYGVGHAACAACGDGSQWPPRAC